ncbi:hypothetical protein Q7C36_007539 [Tachysurus vachellii]|uniref:Uncharacterized protein n=1 Tax=Tachysurus vachellii TaxID=175792 RepID=A0AA88NAH0_TACVA|nr:hypothetical protein Q7C36_007539 [Tachysurus vachellii]
MTAPSESTRHRFSNETPWSYADAHEARLRTLSSLFKASAADSKAEYSDFRGPTCAIHFQAYEAGDLTRVSQQATSPRREDSGNWPRHPLNSQYFSWNQDVVLIK